jgi:hypothetical protein
VQTGQESKLHLPRDTPNLVSQLAHLSKYTICWVVRDTRMQVQWESCELMGISSVSQASRGSDFCVQRRTAE